MKLIRVEPTAAQLQTAFNRLRHATRAKWPDTYEEAAADKTRKTLVHALAVGIAREQHARQDVQRQVPALLQPPTAKGPVPPAGRVRRERDAQKRLPHLTHDPRSAAANDREDRE